MIYKARNSTIPKRKCDPLAVSKFARGNLWYDRACDSKRKDITAMRSYVRRIEKKPLPPTQVPRCTRDDISKAKSEYWAMLEKKELLSYKQSLENIEGCSAMGTFNRTFLKGAINNRVLELFDKPDGTKMTPNETLGSLADAKFPKCKTDSEHEPQAKARKAEEDAASCRQTKHWFPTPHPLKSFQLLNGRSRYEYSVLLHAITGHNHLAYHENKHNTQSSPMCTVCNIDGTSMTTQHLFTECEALAQTRLSVFGKLTLDIPYDISIPAAVRFLRKKGEKIGWLPVDEFRD